MKVQTEIRGNNDAEFVSNIPNDQNHVLVQFDDKYEVRSEHMDEGLVMQFCHLFKQLAKTESGLKSIVNLADMSQTGTILVLIA